VRAGLPLCRFLGCGLLAAPVLAGQAAAPRASLFRHATLVDATRAEARPGMALLVKDGRIQRVLTATEDRNLPKAGLRVLDLKGLYVMPGLVDTHVHLATDPDLRKVKALLTFFAEGGITTVRDMAGDARCLAEARRSLLVGAWTGPSLHYSALMAGPAFFVDPRTKASAQGETPGQVAWMMAVTPDTDLVAAVAQARGTYASGIKLYANLDAELTARIVAEARRQGFPVWAHAALFPARPSDVVATGLTSISHAPMLAYEVAPLPEARLKTRPKVDYTALRADDPAILSVLRTMHARGVALDATMTVFRTPRGQTEKARIQARQEYAFAVQITREAREAGVQVTTGTDAMGSYRTGEPAIWGEMVALQEEAGFSPAEVLAAATVNGARILGLEAEQGTLDAGKRGDFIVLRANPLKDIRAVRTLKLTVVGGRILKRAGYRPPRLLKDED